MKILFSSVGRRVELVQAFQNAAKALDVALKVVGTDMDPSAPAMWFCDDSIKVPPIKNSEYIPTLLRICEQNEIDCLIPTIDTDLVILAENKNAFKNIGTKVLVSDVEKIKLSYEKCYTSNYFNSIGLKAPDVYRNIDAYSASFPAFIKPNKGSGSVDAFKVESQEELVYYANKIDNYVVQPFISGEEYTIDILCDFEGKPIYITPRKRLFVRSGEVTKTKIYYEDLMIKEMKKLVSDFKPVGPITVQLIKEFDSGDNYYIEINPRFGGGAPLSMKAGADSATAILKLLQGEKLEFEPYAARENETYYRYEQSICVGR